MFLKEKRAGRTRKYLYSCSPGDGERGASGTQCEKRKPVTEDPQSKPGLFTYKDLSVAGRSHHGYLDNMNLKR